ncbi:hypothetical protein GE061_009577, partial [Apolygus lucorum]
MSDSDSDDEPHEKVLKKNVWEYFIKEETLDPTVTEEEDEEDDEEYGLVVCTTSSPLGQVDIIPDYLELIEK